MTLSRIKALREFAMKRLTDFFEEKGWKTGKKGYNENRKRSKYCCWTVPMRDWNLIHPPCSQNSSNLHLLCFLVEPYLWEIETHHHLARVLPLRTRWTVPMRDWNQSRRLQQIPRILCWTVPTSEQCAPYTVINVNEKERELEQLMSVRQIWIVQVFYCCVYALCIDCKNLPLRE